jgi:hypothetical protein
METVNIWEALLVGAIALLVFFWFRPGLKAAMQRSQEAEKDWGAVIVPLGLVILFVLLLIALV